MAVATRNKKWIIGASFAAGVLLAGSWLYVNETHQAEIKIERQLTLVGEWVHVDGICDGKAGAIRGLDITKDFLLVEDGQSKKINNMDIVPVIDMPGACQGFGDFQFDFKVVMNTNDLVEYMYAKTSDGTELLKSSSGEYYFRFSPQFKQHYDSIVSANMPSEV
ncbi:hypothetical protein ACRWQL_00720 (plasmid) [Shewanella sp. HL-SH4]|uniref:hypothetical protein n=1 Tax=Shewanella TaxID=22 RepID=UPI003D7B3554